MASIFFELEVQALDSAGETIAGAKLDTFEAGTSTPLATFSDSALTTPHTNPVIADGSGRFPLIYVSPVAYKYVLKDADDVIIWTNDDVNLAVDASSIEDGSITIAKLADGTTGELISWDVLGVATTVATGDAGQILFSNGAGAEPTFQDLGSGSNNILSRGYIDGLLTSRDSGDPDHDIEVAIGEARDSTASGDIVLSSAIVKQIDASWVAGTGVGGFPTGISLSPDTWYHLFVIRDTTNNLTDAGFDTDLSATNLLADATDYSLFRRVGAVLTDSSSNMLDFTQIGDQFLWSNVENDSSAVSSTSQTLITLQTPLGVKTLAKFFSNNPSGVLEVYDHSPDQDDQAPNRNVDPRGLLQQNTSWWQEVWTNTSSQIASRASAATSILYATISYTDLRGKDS